MKIFFVLSLILFLKLSVVRNVSVGGNLHQVRDYVRTLPYVNLIRQAQAWGSIEAPWDGNAIFDPVTGWPTEDFGVIIASEHLDFGGTYLLRAKGNAHVTLKGGLVQDKTYDPITNILTAHIIVRQNASGLILLFENTTGPGLQDLTVLQSGYNQSAESNFTELLLAHLSRFNLIRFMEWIDTNVNFEVNWNETTPLSWPLYHPPKHNPWHTIPYLINQFNHSIDIWINIPFHASDDYMLSLARLMLSELNPRTNIYVEYSNEIWNPVFLQWKANIDLANDSVVNQGDPFHFNYDNSTNVRTWAYRRIAYQIKHVSDLFKTVFGEENVGPWKRVRPILAGDSKHQLIMIDYLDYLNINYGPPTNYLHGIAVAPYFDLGIYKNWTNLNTNQILNVLNMSIDEFLPEAGWSQQSPLGTQAVYAAWFNISVYAYEGGPDITNQCEQCSSEAKTNATRDPRMIDLCLRFLNGWYQFGFETFNWFTAGASAHWGLLEDMRQETIIDTTHMFNITSPIAQLPRPSPKLKAIDQIRETSINLTFGIPIPSSNFNATNYMNHPQSFHYPDLRNLTINSTFYYPIQIFESPIQLNITVYTAGNSGLLEGAINNAQFTVIETVRTENTTIFAPAPIMQFQINQTKIPSIVTFRIKNMDQGYSISSFDIIANKISSK